MLVLMPHRLAHSAAAARVTGNHAAVGVAQLNAARLQARQHEGIGGLREVVMLALKFAGMVVDFADGVGQRVPVLERPECAR
jgi:hypothetical protein